MKRSTITLFLSILCLAPVAARADFTVQLDAGQLVGPINGPAMQIDDLTPGTLNGSLLLLVDLGGPNDTVSNVLTAGQFVSGNDTVIGAGGFNDFNGTNETLTFITSTATHAGDELALRWFPQITFAQYTAGLTTPTAGEYFGTYNPSGGNPDGGDAWVIPSSGVISLNFDTTNADVPGTQDPSLGVASFQVQGASSAVPEPSTYALLGFGLAALIFVVRRRDTNSRV